MKTIARAYLLKQSRMFGSKCSLPNFARIESEENLLGCVFVNTNLPEERVRVLLSEKELSSNLT